MGQYWYPVNLTKKEYVHPHRLGAGLKMWEQLAAHPGTAGALIVLLAAQPQHRGGGDLDIEENWHGPERVDMTKEGPRIPTYKEIAARTIGRWAGDQIAIVGDYAEDTDLAPEHKASTIYGRCANEEDIARYPNEFKDVDPADLFKDITDDVCAVIEHELNGKFVGDGWRDFKRNGEAGA